MVLQEPKLIWMPDDAATKYVAADGSAAADARSPGVQLNMAAVCAEWPERRRYRQAHGEVKPSYPEGTPEETIHAHVMMLLEDKHSYRQEHHDFCSAIGDFPAEMLEDLSWSELRLSIVALTLAELPEYLNTPGCLGAVVNYFDPHIRNHYCAVIKYPDSPYADRSYAIGESLNDPPISYYSLEGLLHALRRLGRGRGPVHITCILSQLPDAVQTVASRRMVALGEEWRDAYDAPPTGNAVHDAAAARALNAARREKPAARAAAGNAAAGSAAAGNAAAGNAAANANAELQAAIALSLGELPKGGVRKTRKQRRTRRHRR